MPDELTLEQELESLKPAEAPQTAPATPPVEGATPSPAPDASQTPETPSSETSEVSLEDQLKEIPDTPSETPSNLTAEQQKILSLIPNAAAAEEMSNQLQGYKAFESSFVRGDFGQMTQMLEACSPQAMEAFKEHLYQQFMVQSDDWVNRWIAEREGNPQFKGLQAVQQELNGLKARLAQQDEGQTRAQQTARQQHATQLYHQHLGKLFDQIKFSEADRRWVAADIKTAVEANPAILQRILNGDPTAVNSIWKKAVTEYAQRDKAAAAGKEAQQQLLDKKKPLIGGSPVTQSGSLPDDIHQVPKGQEDTWMDQQFEKLKKLVKR